MLNFKNEYFTLEKGRTKYPTQFKDKSFLVVYGSKEGGITGTELTAHIYKIPENYYEINAGQLDFSNYPNGIENNFLTIRVTNLDSLFSLPLNFTDWKDISPENLTTTFEKIGVSILDIQKRLSEVAVYIDSGKPDQINLPKLPVGCTWYKDQDENIVALPISDLYGKFQQMIDSLHKTIKDLLDIDYTNLSDELRKETDKLLKELEDLKKQCVLDVTKEGEKQLEILNQASAGLPNRVKAIEKDVADFKAENETQHNELKGEIRTARTENIPAERLIDNSLSAKKLKTATDDDKIKLVNLSDEVKKAMTGNTPVSPTLEKNSVVREYIADGAVDIFKIDNSIYHTEYDVKKEDIWNKIGFKLSNDLKLNNSNVEFSFVTSYDEIKNKTLNFNMFGFYSTPSGIVFEKKIEKLQNGLFKYLFYANNVTHSGIINFNFGYNSPITSNLSGKYYDFLLEVDGKLIEFTTTETPEVMNITKIDVKPIGYETLIDEIYARPITMKDFSEKETLLSTGHSSIDDYQKIIEIYTNFSSFYTGILIFQEKFIPGIYKIENNLSDTNYIYVYLFDRANGGNIKDVFKLNKDNQTFILKESSFIGVQLVTNEKGGKLSYGTGKNYNFSFISGTTVYTKGETAIATNESLSTTSPFNIYRLDIYDLKNEQAILDNKKAISQFSKDVAEGSYREISTIPSENLETLMYIDDVLNVEYNKNILINATSNTFTSSNSISYVPYQAIDEWRYKVKFKLLDINTILKFKSINGEYESGSYIINLGTKEISTGEEQEIMFLPLLEERIGGNIETVSSNAIDINFEVGNFYQIELIRSGLIMKINICDLKNDKIFSWEVTNGKRLHGGLSFGVDSGSIELKVAHLSTALQKGTKAIFIGDSITEGLGMRTNDISKRYASLLRDNYFKGNAICSGMGWGTTGNVKQVLKNIKSYCNYIKYYFVMIGTNQRSTGGVVNWKTQIVEIYNTIRELGGIPIIIVPPLARADSEYILQMRDFILEKGWDTIRMDIATSTGDGITFDSSLSTDGVHFNIQGNQKMYERALVDLKKIM